MIQNDTPHDECVAALRAMCARLVRLTLLRNAVALEWWGDPGLLRIYDEDIGMQRRAIVWSVQVKPWLGYLVEEFIKQGAP